MAKPSRLGLVTTGQGPRPEYVAFHKHLLQAVGLNDMDIAIRHALDGLTVAEIQSLAPAPDGPAIHGYVRAPGKTNARFGEGWTEAWYDLGRSVPLVQRCIDRLEREDRVDATIYCCAEGYPSKALTSMKPLILPYQVVLAFAENVVQTRGPAATIGILTRGTRQRRQQIETWRSCPWATDLSVQFEVLGTNPLEGARRLAAIKPNLVIYWGYGTGLAPTDPPFDELEQILGQSIIMPHVAATLFARSLLIPSIRGREYV